MTKTAGVGLWEEVLHSVGAAHDTKPLGRLLSDAFRQHPERLLTVLSHYKFAAKMIGRGKRVLDIGCGEGLGTWILGKECGSAVGVDPSPEAIAAARECFAAAGVQYLVAEPGAPGPITADALTAFDVLENIEPEQAPAILEALFACLPAEGMAILGAKPFPLTANDHTPWPCHYSPQRLERHLGCYFHHVFLFNADNENIQYGYRDNATFLIALACGKRF